MPNNQTIRPSGQRLRIDMQSSPSGKLSVPGFVVAIDGPAGAGKSTASRLLAQRLGYQFLDTGAMYRCVTLAALRAGLDKGAAANIGQLARDSEIHLDGEVVCLNREDVSQAIRSPEVSAAIGAIADNREVRDYLSQLQRNWAQGKFVVTEGRDQGSVVFYDSPCKIFLTASDEERARRRCEELQAKGIATNFEDVLAQQRQRDAEDFRRSYGGLKVADDAQVLLTDGMTLEQVVDALTSIVESKLHAVQSQASSPSHRAESHS